MFILEKIPHIKQCISDNGINIRSKRLLPTFSYPYKQFVAHMNVPANPNHYWRYRMHITLEQLLQIRFFNRKIAAIIKNSGR
jgi:4-alpha-glucanotransferase